MRVRDRRVLALVTDAYGGLGGIAAYNRDVLHALSDHPKVAESVIIPRVCTFVPDGLPERVVQRNEAMGSNWAYLRTIYRELRREQIDLVHCGHANLAPVALVVARLARVPWTMSLHGIEVWERRSCPLRDRAIAGANLYLPISTVTEQRFRAAYPGAQAGSVLMPNALHRAQFAPGPRPAALAKRYGLEGAAVVMTMSRLGEDYLLKGFERIIRLLPQLAETVPGVRYVICGGGPARAQLEAVAASVGVTDRLVFTGYVDEAEKADHYRLADAFVMPSTGEGFGFVFTEAMACGIPVVGSSTDGGYDALRGGTLGQAVDPLDSQALLAAIKAALAAPKTVPRGLDYFDYPNFRQRFHDAIEPYWKRPMVKA